MSVMVRSPFVFDNTFVRDLEGLYERWLPAPVPEPRLLVLNEALTAELGADPEQLRDDTGVAMLAGNALPDGAEPVAQAYAGHQFGGFSPRLGDGRALLLGEVVDVDGRRRDLHVKGSGPTPFARGGDGRAAVGPMLREHVIGEAMHALGVPTTRALAVVATGDHITRQAPVPGAVLTRVASSHLRVGSFQYAAATGDPDLLRRLLDHAIARHHSDAAGADVPALALLDEVVERQASLVARWMLVGFVHGVMNTDNVTISGETIDYGPCAFLDASDPATVFSSIDHGGRYAFGNQPPIAWWNLARLAEALLPLVDDDVDAAVAAVTEVLQTFRPRFEAHLAAGARAKLGLADAHDGDDDLIGELRDLMHEHRLDHTGTYRRLGDVLRGADAPLPLADWAARWRDRVQRERSDLEAVADELDRVNPVYVPRNHLVDEALVAAEAGDLEPFEQLVEVVTDPFRERPGLERYAEPAPDEFTAGFRTFCGT